jgi:Zinc finger C-x8-C-x5-C-x3-H type (and similar)
MSTTSSSIAVKKHAIDGVQLAKTRLCLFFQEGRCKYGSECTYAHAAEEVKKAPEELRKTKFCELFLTQGCNDPDCNFAHDNSELRSKREARRKSRLSIRSSLADGDDQHAMELMQQLAHLLATASSDVSTPTQSAPEIFTLDDDDRDLEHLSGLTELLDGEYKNSSKRESTSSTCTSFSLF